MGDIHIPDSAVADYNRMEDRATEYNALSTHSKVLIELERDPKLMADCLSSIGESLDINLIIGLHRVGHDARIGQLLTDALYKELEAKV